MLVRLVLPCAIMLCGLSAIAQGPGDDGLKGKREHRRGFVADLPREEREGRTGLFRMMRALQTVSFSAREVVTSIRGTVEFDVWVDPKKGSRRESIPRNGDVMVDNLEHWWMMSSRKGRISERPSLRAQAADRYKELIVQLRDTLKATKTGEDTIDNRPVDIILVSPRLNTMGLSQKFWVDRETGMQLKAEERDANGRVVRASYLISVKIRPDLNDIDFSEPKSTAGKPLRKDVQTTFASFIEAEKTGIVIHAPSFIPSGFTPQSVEVSNNKEWITVHWSNGATVLSYSRISNRRPTPSTEPAFKPIPGGRRGYIWNADGVMHVLIAPLRDELIVKIAQSIR